MPAEGPACLVLVRHAPSARNVAKKGNAFFLDDEMREAVQGIADHYVQITDEGRRQAEVTGHALLVGLTLAAAPLLPDTGITVAPAQRRPGDLDQAIASVLELVEGRTRTLRGVDRRIVLG